MHETSDIETIDRFKKGDAQAETRLFELFHKPLFFFIESIAHNTDEANDIVVKAFIKLWEQKAILTDLLHAKKFLFLAAKHLALSFLKTRKRHLIKDKELFYLFDEAVCDDEIEHAEITSALIDAVKLEINNLPGQCRRIMRMIFLEGMSTLQVSERLGVAKKTVLSQKARGLLLLKIKLIS